MLSSFEIKRYSQTIIFKTFPYHFQTNSGRPTRHIFKTAKTMVSVQFDLFFPANSIFKMSKKYLPTNSDTSASSKLCIVMSKTELPTLTQISLLLNEIDFLEWMVSMTFFLIVVTVLAKLMAFVNRSLETDGEKPTM